MNPMEDFYLEAKKPRARAEFKALTRSFDLENAIVKHLFDDARASGTLVDGIATWIVVLQLVLTAYAACRKAQSSYGYVFDLDARLRLETWSTRYPATTDHRRTAESLLAWLPARSLPVDDIAHTIFNALDYAIKRGGKHEHARS